jgi:uncharacterized membrane protein
MTKKRISLVKAITYRVWQSVNTFLIALFFTHKFETAAQIVGLEVLVKVVVYYWHERIWEKIESKTDKRS